MESVRPKTKDPAEKKLLKDKFRMDNYALREIISPTCDTEFAGFFDSFAQSLISESYELNIMNNVAKEILFEAVKRKGTLRQKAKAEVAEIRSKIGLKNSETPSGKLVRKMLKAYFVISNPSKNRSISVKLQELMVEAIIDNLADFNEA